MHFTDIGDDNGLFMSGIWMNKYQLSTYELWTYDLNTIYHVHVGTSDPYMQNNVCQLEPKCPASKFCLNLCQPSQLLSSRHPEWSTFIESGV